MPSSSFCGFILCSFCAQNCRSAQHDLCLKEPCSGGSRGQSDLGVVFLILFSFLSFFSFFIVTKPVILKKWKKLWLLCPETKQHYIYTEEISTQGERTLWKPSVLQQSWVLETLLEDEHPWTVGWWPHSAVNGRCLSVFNKGVEHEKAIMSPASDVLASDELLCGFPAFYFYSCTSETLAIVFFFVFLFFNAFCSWGKC